MSRRIHITLKGWEALAEMKVAQRNPADVLPADIGSLLQSEAYRVVERNSPPPMKNLKPGEIVAGLEWNGYPAKWMNGVMYVAERHFKEE